MTQIESDRHESAVQFAFQKLYEVLSAEAEAQGIPHLHIAVELKGGDKALQWAVWGSDDSVKHYCRLQGEDLRAQFDEVCRRVVWEHTQAMKTLPAPAPAPPAEAPADDLAEETPF